MLKKFAIVLSVAAALGLGVVLTVPGPVSAQGFGAKNDHKGERQNAPQRRKMQGNGNMGRRDAGRRNNFVVGHRYGGHIWYGRNRHEWHGTWYEYGVGPCWINVGGLWFWNVVACP